MSKRKTSDAINIENSKLVAEYQRTKDKNVLQKILDTNRGLICDKIKNVLANHNDYDDMLQEGYIGLMTAVDRYDPEIGNSFATYASYWVMDAVNKWCIKNKNGPLHIPVHIIKSLVRIKRYCEDNGITVEEAYAKDISADIANELSVSVDTVNNVLTLLNTEYEASIMSDGNDLFDRLPSTSTEDDPEDITNMESKTALLSDLIDELPEDVSAATRMYYGIGLERSHLLHELATYTGEPTHQMRNLVRRGVSRLRKRIDELGLDPECLL